VEAQAVSLRVKTLLAIAGLALFGLIAGAQSGEAKTTKGPRGLAFYKPPKHLPREHGP
jgi:hypothetical protein